MKKILFLAVVAVIFTGCSSVKQPKISKTECEQIQVGKVAKCSVGTLEISGIFIAQLNCEGCTNAKSTLTLNPDNTYRLDTAIDGVHAGTMTENGTFKTSGSEVIVTNQYREEKRFKFDGKNLQMLATHDAFDMRKSPLTGAIYKQAK